MSEPNEPRPPILPYHGPTVQEPRQLTVALLAKNFFLSSSVVLLLAFSILMVWDGNDVGSPGLACCNFALAALLVGGSGALVLVASLAARNPFRHRSIRQYGDWLAGMAGALHTIVVLTGGFAMNHLLPDFAAPQLLALLMALPVPILASSLLLVRTEM